MFPAEIEFLEENPRELLIGTGWIFAGGVWSKPHNTYIGLVIGGGLMSLISIFIALRNLFRGRIWRLTKRRGVLGIILLISLSVELAINGYLAGRLEYLAGILSLWIAWSAIMYQNPVVAKEHESNSKK
jgi:hypothetical protein